MPATFLLQKVAPFRLRSAFEKWQCKLCCLNAKWRPQEQFLWKKKELNPHEQLLGMILFSFVRTKSFSLNYWGAGARRGIG